GSVRQSAGKLTRARRCTGSRSSRTSSEASSPTPTCATSPPDHSPPTYDLISNRTLSGPVAPVDPRHEHDLAPVRILVGHAAVRLPVGGLRRRRATGSPHPAA